MPYPGGAKVASERRSGRNVASEGLKRVKDRVEGTEAGEVPRPGEVAWSDEAGEMLRPGARGWRRERGGLPACKRIAAD